MDKAEQRACTDWLIAVMAEEVGKGETSRPTLPSFAKDEGYESVDGFTPVMYNEVLSMRLNQELADKLEQLVAEKGSYWDAWPELADSELVVIMEAGGYNYL